MEAEKSAVCGCPEASLQCRSMDKTENGLWVLLEHLKTEIDAWQLDPFEENPPATTDTIRYGLYLIALDILFCETRYSSGYEAYQGLPSRTKIPKEDYDNIRTQLAPYIAWLDGLNVSRLIQLKRTGLTESAATQEIAMMDQPVVNAWLDALS